MRKAFVNTVTAMARQNEDVMIVIGDTGFSVFEEFEAEFPARFINVGIAEQNFVAFSAGLAMQGVTTYAYNVISFMTLRALEQIQLDICYQENPVILVGVGSAYNYGTAGPTHHAIQDIAIMRALPNMNIICPGDPYEMQQATMQAARLHKPCYIRICRSADPVVHQGTPPFIFGKAMRLSEGSDVALISTGGMLKDAVTLTERLQSFGLGVRHVRMHTLVPLDEQAVLDAAASCRLLVTLEDHSILGGLYSSVAELLFRHGMTIPVLPFAFKHEFAPYAGTKDEQHRRNGMDCDTMFRTIAARF